MNCIFYRRSIEKESDINSKYGLWLFGHSLLLFSFRNAVMTKGERKMTNIKWFKDPNNISYVDANEFMDHFGKEIGVENLWEKVKAFADNPTKEGQMLKGTKRTSIKLFIPDLTFDEHLEMGENVWMFMGEHYDCYCIYNL